MKLLAIAILIIASGCSANRGIRLIGATAEEKAQAQETIDYLRIQTNGVVSRYLEQDEDAETDVVFTDFQPKEWHCGYTSADNKSIEIYACGWQSGMKVFGGVLLHELVHAEGVHDHSHLHHNQAMMAPTYDPEQTHPYCLHAEDLRMLCAETGCDFSAMLPCDDFESELSY